MKLLESHFTENLVRLNAMRFTKWVFEPGMLFLSESKWWGSKGDRGERHNGLDLLSYESDDGKLRTIGAGTNIPIIYAGTIVRCIKDFLGYTLFAAHEIYEGNCRLFTVYGHVQPATDVPIGKLLDEGAVIATLHAAAGMKVPGHLHISAAFIPNIIPLEALSWENLNETKNVSFLDPLIIIQP